MDAGVNDSEFARVTTQYGSCVLKVIPSERAAVGKMNQQAAEQGRILSWRHGKKQIRLFRRRRKTWIDDDNLGASVALVLHHALEEDRMAPRGIGTGKDDEVSFVDVFIGAGHQIRAKSTAMAGDGGRHAQA